MSSVTVLCPNARRCSIKVTPGMLLKQVLEEACLRQGFDEEAYELVNQKRRVDLALPFRLSGLPNNATLEMVPYSSIEPKGVATIALQIPQRERLELEFSISESLLSVLKSFSELFGEDLTRSENALVPCCFYMNRQYTGQEELGRVTLSSIGITSGRCLIRYHRLPLTQEQRAAIVARLAEDTAKKEALLPNYIQKKTENEDRAKLEAIRLERFEQNLRSGWEKKERKLPTAQGVVEVGLPYVRDILGSPPRNSGGWSFDALAFSVANQRTGSDRLNNLNLLLQQADSSLNGPSAYENDRLTNILADERMLSLSRIANEVQRMEEVTSAVSTFAFAAPCDRQPVVFSRQPSVDLSAMESELSDGFFDVGLDDLKNRQKELHEEVRMYTQRAVVPKQYVTEKNRERKLSAYCHSVVRISLETQQIIQVLFLSGEPVSRLYEWVRSILPPDLPFSLSLPPNEKIEESDSKNFVDANIAPKSTVFLKGEKRKTDFASLVCGKLLECTREQADKMSAEWLSHNSAFIPFSAVLVESDRSTKRPASSLHPSSSEPVRPPHKAGSASKWLKKK